MATIEPFGSTPQTMTFEVDEDFSLLSLAHGIIKSRLLTLPDIAELADYLQVYVRHHENELED